MRRVRYGIQDFFQYRNFLAPFRRRPIELAIAERAPSRLISILGCFGYLLALMNLVDYCLYPQSGVWG
ncbi:MAG: hypothetical protein ACK5CA_05230 [Cyanobacteriota bacterium]